MIVLQMITLFTLLTKVRRLIKQSKAQVESFDSEDELLTAFLNKWYNNPSIVTGWNIDYFDVTYLYNRLKNRFYERLANKLSPIIKFIGTNIVKIHYRRCISIRLSVQCYTYTELPNYRLDTVATTELGRGKIEYEGNLDQLFRDDIEKFIEQLSYVELVVDMDKKLQFIDLARAICHTGHVFYEDYLFSSNG